MQNLSRKSFFSFLASALAVTVTGKAKAGEVNEQSKEALAQNQEKNLIITSPEQVYQTYYLPCRPGFSGEVKVTVTLSGRKRLEFNVLTPANCWNGIPVADLPFPLANGNQKLGVGVSNSSKPRCFGLLPFSYTGCQLQLLGVHQTQWGESEYHVQGEIEFN